MGNKNPENQWEEGKSGNPAGFVRLSWKKLIEEIGAESTEGDDVQSKWGKTRKEAVVRRLFHEIIVNKQVHLLGKLMEYTEPSTRQVNIDIIDWHDRLAQSGIPREVLADRYRKVIEDNARPTLELTPGRPDSSISAPGFAQGETDGQTPVGADSQAEPAPEDPSLRDPVRGSQGRGEELRITRDSAEQSPAQSDSPPELRPTGRVADR